MCLPPKILQGSNCDTLVTKKQINQLPYRITLLYRTLTQLTKKLKHCFSLLKKNVVTVHQKTPDLVFSILRLVNTANKYRFVL